MLTDLELRTLRKIAAGEDTRQGQIGTRRMSQTHQRLLRKGMLRDRDHGTWPRPELITEAGHAELAQPTRQRAASRSARLPRGPR